MLSSRTSEREHQRGKTTLDITTHMGISQLIDTLQKGQYLTIILQETDNRLVQSCQLLIGLVTSRVMRTAAVKHIATAIAALVLWNTLAIGKTIYFHHQRTLCVIFREGRWTVLRMRGIGISVCCLIAVSTTCDSSNLLELGQLSEFAEQ